MEKSRVIPYIRFKFIEFFLGMALGIGYLTSLRFTDYIGVSEIFFLVVALLLSQLYLKKVFLFKNNYESILRLYLLSVFIIIAPIVTITTSLFSEHNSSPIYLLPYSFGILLSLLIVNAIKNNISMKSIVLWFLFFFVVTNLISIYVINLGVDKIRYTGGAKNPNQLLFYSSSLTLLLIIYLPRAFILAFPIITFIMLKTGSDAYILSVVMIPIIYIVIKLFSFKRGSYGVNILYILFIGILLTVLTVSIFSNELVAFWLAADNGNVRTRLMTNGFIATLESPIFGWGTGSFSGISAPFKGWEAHNTFFDLSSQFGFITPIILYFFMIAFLIKQFINKNYLVTAFVVSYIIAGLFHNYSRHFVFWVEIAIFYHSFFKKSINSKGLS